MHWVIQNGPIREEGYIDLVDALKRYNIPFTEVTVVPFSHELRPDVNPEGPVIAMGTLSLANKVVARKGWKPGSFSNENFDFGVWNEKWEGHTLNGDAVVCPFSMVPATHDVFFIRPCADNKAFTGQVMSLREYQTWMGRLLMNEKASDLNFDMREMVCVAPLKDIAREVRFFVVGDKVVTHSTYQIGGKLKQLDDTMTDPEMIEFVEDRIRQWTPDKAFCIDVALVEDGYKVIEINCLNSAGFYKADVYKLVQALEGLCE